MTRKINYTRALIWVLLLYGLLVTVFDLDFMAVFVDEAYHINIGRQILEGTACSGCPFATGYPYMHPVIAAIGDRIGGLEGARAVSMILGLALTLFVYLTAKKLFGEKLGVISAAMFLFAGQTMYLMKLATYDMTAAFLLGTGFMLVVFSIKAERGAARHGLLIAGMVILFAASITKYLLPVFVPPIAVYAFWKHRFSWSMILSVALLAAAAALFWFYAPFSPRIHVMGQISDVRSTSRVSLAVLTDWTLRWVALSWLLSVFGMFHQKYGKTAMVLFLLSLPIILVHLFTGAEQSVNKNILFSLIFLAPASALGVDHIGTLFSMRSSSLLLRRFFTAAVITVFWAYGINNFKWLEKQYPDVAPMIQFFEAQGFDGMTVALNGWDADIYSYSLRDRFPNARYMHITEAVKKDADGNLVNKKADFIVCEDNYYGRLYPCADYGDYIDDDYAMLAHFMFELSWGTTDSRIFGRR